MGSHGSYRSLLLSLSFAHHVLGLDGGEMGFKSSRVKGLADAYFVDRRKLVQRPPLTVDQVMHLERVVARQEGAKHDRLAAGFFLLLVYGRLRFSDAMRIKNFRLDVVRASTGVAGFLEGEAERTKTSVTLERKIRLLPLAVPILSFVDPSDRDVDGGAATGGPLG